MRRKDSSRTERKLSARRAASACARVIILLAAAVSTTAAQQMTAETTTATPPPSSSPMTTATTAATTAPATPANTSATDATDERYRIGPGDVLDVRVFNRPQLSRDAVRVDGRGMIRMPLIEEEISAACLTEGELSRSIATSYLKYQRNPQVDVFVKDYQSQPVAIIGAVNKPGQFQLQRRVRLLELLSLADGPSGRAGRAVQLVRSAPALRCDASGASQTGADAAEGFSSYSLSDTLQGKEAANPYLRPGDIVNVIEAAQAFVVGNVLRPVPIDLREQVTVSQAIAMAGGTLPNTRKDKIRIIRQTPGSTTRTELFADLKAIDKRRADDVVLQPGDIVEVQTVTGVQSLVKGVLSTLIPTLTQYPTSVILR
jgi:polysaccharide export outer membrane protein